MDLPLEVEQFAVVHYGSEGLQYLARNGNWSSVAEKAAIFNDFNIARLIAGGVRSNTRVETRETFRMPMPV